MANQSDHCRVTSTALYLKSVPSLSGEVRSAPKMGSGPFKQRFIHGPNRQSGGSYPFAHFCPHVFHVATHCFYLSLYLEGTVWVRTRKEGLTDLRSGHCICLVVCNPVLFHFYHIIWNEHCQKSEHCQKHGITTLDFVDLRLCIETERFELRIYIEHRRLRCVASTHHSPAGLLVPWGRLSKACECAHCEQE